jgi:hypothetical protein
MLRKEWTGLMVCEGCFETKHPQLLIHVPKEDSAIPWTRPESTDTFISVSYPLATEVADYDFIYTESGVILNS